MQPGKLMVPTLALWNDARLKDIVFLSEFVGARLCPCNTQPPVDGVAVVRFVSFQP